MRCVAAYGEVIDIFLHLDAVVYLQRVIDGEVIDRIVVMAHEIAAVENADEILNIGLISLTVDAEVLKLKIVHAL